MCNSIKKCTSDDLMLIIIKAGWNAYQSKLQSHLCHDKVTRQGSWESVRNYTLTLELMLFMTGLNKYDY